MKKFLFILLLFILSCSKEEAQIITFEKISDNGNIYSFDDIKNIGFKKNKEYDIKDLPNADSAYFGFIKNELGEPNDYEIRFYDTHNDTLKHGIKYADNIIGDIGCISKDCALWEEGIKDRIRMSDLGTLHPKYMIYIVFDNFILFCPGYEEKEAKDNCSYIIKKLKN